MNVKDRFALYAFEKLVLPGWMDILANRPNQLTDLEESFQRKLSPPHDNIYDDLSAIIEKTTSVASSGAKKYLAMKKSDPSRLPVAAYTVSMIEIIMEMRALARRCQDLQSTFGELQELSPFRTKE